MISYFASATGREGSLVNRKNEVKHVLSTRCREGTAPGESRAQCKVNGLTHTGLVR